MKKILLVSFLIASMVLSFFPFARAKAAEEPNLISNPSVKTRDASWRPVDWQKSQWGTSQVTFAYLTDSGYQDKTSLHVKVKNYRDGDAKWFFKPVEVAPLTKYAFSDYYRSSVKTQVVIQYTLQDDTVSYVWLGELGYSMIKWKRASYNFETPANAKKLTIFHLINKNGFLATDEFSLKKVEPVKITANVPNSSLEQSADGLTPNSWQSNSWGTNQAVFSYLNEGHTGNKSIKTEIKSYLSGDAKWFYDEQPIEVGKTYEFSDYYKSNVQSQVVLQITKIDGTVQYLGLRSVGPANSWTKYSDIFTAPAGSRTMTVFHLITAVGYLITDDYSVLPYTGTGLNRPLLTLTFDDSWEVNYDSVLPKLTQYGFKSSQFYATTYIENNPEEQFKAKAFAEAGHEIGSHSISHPFLTTLTNTQLADELSQSKSYLENLLSKQVTSFATPYGDYDGRVTTAIKNYYTLNRNTDVGYNRKESFDAYNIRVQNITNTTTPAEVQSWINQAIADNSWLVIVYHQVTPTPEAYDTTPANFVSNLDYIQQTGITVKTMRDALAEVSSQVN